MGILDEAIREHLELKRQHGAADSELQQLEDEAFGQAERPGGEQGSDTAAEAPTEFMTVPETGEKPRQRQEPSVADLQEAPPPPEPADEEPSEEETPADEEDRQAIAEQPTEHFDVEEELAGSAAPGPTDEELVEEEISEPRLAPVDPLADMEAVEEIEVGATPEAELEDDEEEDEFWSDQRLSEELDQALDAPLPDEAPPAAEAEVAEETAPPAEDDDEDAPAPSGGSAADHDVLEDTPDFLEDAPEDDELWFEQKPPKDFDFDD
jgi:hypothetical protein